jgi:hypothetical protein
LEFLIVAAPDWEIEFYELANGDQPCQDWLDCLSDSRAKARINLRLDRLCDGNFGDYKSVGQGVLELRMPFGPAIPNSTILPCSIIRCVWGHPRMELRAMSGKSLQDCD